MYYRFQISISFHLKRLESLLILIIPLNEKSKIRLAQDKSGSLRSKLNNYEAHSTPVNMDHFREVVNESMYEWNKNVQQHNIDPKTLEIIENGMLTTVEVKNL